MRLVQTWAGNGGAPAGFERHCPVLWSKWEPAPGRYDYAFLDSQLANQATPCHLAIAVCAYNKTAGMLDYTPPCHAHPLHLTTANGKTGIIPDYANADWQAAYAAAVAALAARYRDHPQVVAYWHGLGLDQETHATRKTADGADWNAAAQGLLSEDGYYNFIVASTRQAVSAWGAVPVYVPGAPNPGETWGRGRSRVSYVQDALRTGARYQMCGLKTDNDNATGLGGHAGLMLTDIIPATGVRCAFEPGKDAGGDPWELYWLLVRACHWGADFVDLQRSWLPHYPTVAPYLPQDGRRWLVFRDAEFPAQSWTGGNGIKYGQSGEVGCFGRGLTWLSGGQLNYDAARYDWARWYVYAPDGLTLGASDLPDGDYTATVYRPPDSTDTRTLTVQGGQVRLPPGSYHRVDLGELVPEPVKPSFEDALRAAAEAHDVLPIYADAALAKAGFAAGLWPTSDEFEFTYAGAAYVAQRFRVPHSAAVRVLYCVKGAWDTIMALSY